MLTRSLTAPISRLRQAAGTLPQRLGWLPTALLALALAGVFALNSDREHFYAPIEWNSAKNLAIAENLSPQHNFRLFVRLTPPLPGEGEEPFYDPYHRFPIGSFALIKLVILPFGDDLGAKVFAGRMLMLAFLSAAALLAYHAIARIASSKWIALTAVLIAFSSYHILWFADHISNEMMIGLFGVMLTFHGMTIFVQEGKFRQLLIKACAALLLDWHVYALLAPFVALGLGRELFTAVRARYQSSDSGRAPSNLLIVALSTLVRSRYSRLGAVTLLFGLALLSYNVMSEYDALNGETPITDLPSVRSMVNRGGLSFDRLTRFPWDDYLVGQFYRAASASIPYWLMETEWLFADTPPNAPPPWLVAAGVIVSVASLAGAMLVRRQRLLLGTLVLFSFCWTLPMRSQTLPYVHVYEGIYWIAVPLTFATLILLAAQSIGFVRRLIPVAAALAALAFSMSAYEMMAKGPESEKDVAYHQALFSDFENIRKTARGKTVVIAQTINERWALYGGFTSKYFLAGSLIRYLEEELPAEYDFVLIPHHQDASAPLLTPENQIAFLHGKADPHELRLARMNSILSSVPEEPFARAAYDVYRGDRSVVYVQDPCVGANINLYYTEKIFLHVFPDNVEDLPEWRKRQGYDDLSFIFPARSVLHDGKCAASVPLPDYAISGVRTGQRRQGAGELWDAAFSFDAEEYQAAYESVASLDPDARAEFNVHIDESERTITYTREPCAAPDVERPFFLHVFPDRADDLPEERRDVGFESLDFDFRLNGAVFEDKCAAKVSLPEYAIAGVRTGQWIRSEGELWSAPLPFNPDALRAAYESVASRQPDARDEFNVYLDEDERALTYTREPCAAPDVEPSFFLHVVPEREDDLPEERRSYGFHNLDFDFRVRGAMFDGKCAAQFSLPEYEIAAIRTGQRIRGEGRLWETSLQPSR